MTDKEFRNERSHSGNLGLFNLKMNHNYCRIPADCNDLGGRLGISSCSKQERVEIETPGIQRCAAFFANQVWTCLYLS